MTRPWIVLGGGGHAGVVIDALLLLGHSVLGYTDPAPQARLILDIECLGSDDAIGKYGVEDIFLANGLGSTSNTEHRATLYQRFAGLGFVFPPIIHPSAVVARSAHLGAGTQVMAGAILQTQCRVGENVLVNTRASVDHDCVIESDVHIAPGVTVSGGVLVERGAHIGTGASIVQGRRIGSRSTVGAGTVIIHDVKRGITVVGVPGKPIGL